MSISFSSGELLAIAIDIERNGIAFYDVMAKSAENEEVRCLFQSLVDMEHRHIETFQAMLLEAGGYGAERAYEGEEAAYLKSLVESNIFSDDAITGEMVTRLDSDIEALELAVNLEKDSILFYYQLKDIAQPKEQKLLDGIIAEEKSHLRDLSAVRRELASGQ
ncbi:ferritin family protein [Chloroflexota bacterium]